MKYHLTFAVSLTLAQTCLGQVTVNFANSDLNQFTNTSPANWSIPADSGYLRAASDGNTTSINGSYLNQTFSLSGNGHSITMEAVYLWAGVNVRNNNSDVIRLGLSATTVSDPLPEYSGALRGAASGNRNHRVGNYDGTNLAASASAVNIINSAVPLVVESVFTRVNSTTLNISTTLWNSSKTATSIPTLDRTITVDVGFFDNPLYAGLFVNGDAARITDTNWTSEVRIDSFTVTAIPEPSTYAALLGLMTLGLVALRRRR